jgi:hypothetical protein
MWYLVVRLEHITRFALFFFWPELSRKLNILRLHSFTVMVHISRYFFKCYQLLKGTRDIMRFCENVSCLAQLILLVDLCTFEQQLHVSTVVNYRQGDQHGYGWHNHFCA